MTTPLNEKQLEQEFRKREWERMKKLAWLRVRQLVCGIIFVILGCLVGWISLTAYNMFAAIRDVSGYSVLAHFAGACGLVWLALEITGYIGKYIHSKLLYWRKGVMKANEKRKEANKRSAKSDY